MIYNPDAVIAAFRDVARPIMLRYMGRQTCINSTRLTVEALRVFGVTARPVPVRLVVQCEDLKFAYVSGFSGKDKERMRAQCKNWVNRGEGWVGHVIARYRDWLVDSSIDQAESLDHGFRVPPMVLTYRLPPEVRMRRHMITLKGVSADGHAVEVRYYPHFDHSFHKTDAWRFGAGEAYIVAQIAHEMRRRL